MLKKLSISMLLAGSLAVLFWRPWAKLQAQLDQNAPFDSSVQTVLIRYGITDQTGKVWTGRLQPEGGDARMVALKGYHFQPPDTADGASGAWKFQTRPWMANFQQVDLSPARPSPRAVFPNGIYATVKGSPSARFRLTEEGSSFSFSLADLAEHKLLTTAAGNIEIEQVPTPLDLSNPQRQADLPALAAGPSDRLALVFQEYVDNRDRVIVREINPKNSSLEVFDLPETQDVFRPSAVYDGGGDLHVVWSAQVDGNWDLYERRKSAQDWLPVERLTQAPGPDLHQKVIVDPNPA